MRIWRSILMLALACGLLSLPAMAETPGDNITFFGGALFGSPSGFLGGAQIGIPIAPHVQFEPGIALGRAGSDNVFTLDGTFLYNFDVSDTGIKPYILGGVGLAQWGGSTHGSPIIGAGLRFPIGDGAWIRPEFRIGSHGLSRFTIGLSKSF